MATELYAAARVIGNQCYDENLEYMKCKAGTSDPVACATQGEEVHRCVYALFKDINAKASKQFGAYRDCLDGSDLDVSKCKKTQSIFEKAYYAA